MPYLNEHSARLQDPGRFDPKTYRRVKGGTIYGKIKVPKTIAVIWGKLKTHNKPSDKPIPQALRFPTKSWTADKARKWLKNNNIKYIRFEPAKKSKQAEHERQFIDSISKDPFVFNMHGPVEFAEGQNEGEKNKVRLTLYDGSITKHFYWGNLAFDLKTMKMAKKKNPILFSHDTNQRVAYSTDARFEGKFVMDGTFLKSSVKAQEIKAEMEEGFPFESSLRFDPDKSIIEHVGDGQSVRVNGHILKGPGTVIKNALIVEGSICVFGLLKNTVSEAFDILELKENIMSEETELQELTAEILETDYPDIFEEVMAKGRGEGRTEGRAEGEKAAIERFGELKKLAPDDPKFVIEQFAKGESIEDAKTALIAHMRKQKATKAEKKETEVDPAVAEFSDDAANQQVKETDTPKTDEERFTAEFNADEKIQAEFGGAEGLGDYIAFRKAEEQGRVHIAGKR